MNDDGGDDYDARKSSSFPAFLKAATISFNRKEHVVNFNEKFRILFEINK